MGPAALDTSDYTARVILTDLPAGQRVFYRVLFQDLTDLKTWSLPQAGSFRTPEATPRRNVTIAWSADTVGQGWGINQEWGGLKLYDAMRRADPDVFINCGDTIYADQPVPKEVKLDDGTVWRNVVTEAKSKVAETLDEFRGQYKYNLLDDHMRAFNAEVPQIVIWDDHEVRDNWYETRDLDKDDRYKVKSMALIAARAKKAFLEFNPIAPTADDPERIYRVIPYGPLVDVFTIDLRSYRGANSENTQPSLSPESRIFGEDQLASLKSRLAASRATWKIVACDMPIGLVVRDGAAIFRGDCQRRPRRPARARAGGCRAAPLHPRPLDSKRRVDYGRRSLLRGASLRSLAGRVHGVRPFWEFVAGPLHAGTFGPAALDKTFGPEVRFSGIPPGMKGNRPPSDGLQFFGLLQIDARTRQLTVSLRNLDGKTLYSIELPPR